MTLLLALLLPVARVHAQTPVQSDLKSDPGIKTEAKPVTTKTRTIALSPEKANPVSIKRFEKPPVIDGKLDDEAWKNAAAFGDFYQTQPGDNITPSRLTTVLIGYDSKHLYVAFHAYDDPQKVRAHVAKRDQVFDDDTVQLILDTLNDRRKGYILAFNPFGIQADGIISEGSGNGGSSEDYSLDIVMESKGTLTEDGYIVEVAIPFKSLRYEAGKGKLWGFHAFRRIKRLDDERDSWMPISRDQSSLLNQEGHITGLDGISTERNLDIIPTLTVSESGARIRTLSIAAVNADPSLQDPGRFINPAAKLDPGLTVKFGITPTITLDFTANPDFAQVEADQTVLTANQRFPIFFD
ncbi:MAG TPA: sugar-binding protein, partial [Blastocatellia bacterium]|nr:sugar-binding protein [Blastocatellia bacterium]